MGRKYRLSIFVNFKEIFLGFAYFFDTWEYSYKLVVSIVRFHVYNFHFEFVMLPFPFDSPYTIGFSDFPLK